MGPGTLHAYGEYQGTLPPSHPCSSRINVILQPQRESQPPLMVATATLHREEQGGPELEMGSPNFQGSSAAWFPVLVPTVGWG